MQLVEKKYFRHSEIIKKQGLISSLTYWKNHLMNVVNKSSLLKNKLLVENTPY